MSGGVATTPPIGPAAINDSGQIAGGLTVNANGWVHAAIAQGGQVTDLSQEFNLNGRLDSTMAISNSGYAIVQEGLMGGSNPVHYLLYSPNGPNYLGQTAPSLTDLTELPGGSGKIAIALNDLGQVVGNNFLYTNGQFLSLQGLLPLSASSGWMP